MADKPKNDRKTTPPPSSTTGGSLRGIGTEGRRAKASQENRRKGILVQQAKQILKDNKKK